MERRARLYRSTRSTDLDAAAGEVWAVVASGYSRPQWYVDAAPLLLRGRVDRLLGGPGHHRPPPGTPVLSTGDAAGFWRVVSADHAALVLALEAEVRAPGRVVLTSEVHATEGDGCRLTQTVELHPRGLLGRAYLVAVLPARELLIELVHRRLLEDLARS